MQMYEFVDYLRILLPFLHPWYPVMPAPSNSPATALHHARSFGGQTVIFDQVVHADPFHKVVRGPFAWTMSRIRPVVHAPRPCMLLLA